MKRVQIIVSILCLLSITTGIAQDKEVKLPAEYPFAAPGSESRGVFGEDGREEVNDVSGITHYTNATAVMIPKKNVDGDKVYGYSLRQSLSMQFNVDRFDQNVKYLDQPTVGNCTGFLVAPEIIVTAGHCINSMDDANQWYWLFDYTNSMQWNLEGNYINIDRNNLYETSEILGSKLEGEEDDELEDYAVLRLDRVVTNRQPYRIRTSGDTSVSSNVYTIGAPTGLPLKISLDSEVIDEGNDYWFKTDIDAFPGNSGGPVFDPNGFIEGILVRGAVEYANGRYTGDYKYDPYCDCIRTVTFAQAGLTAGCQIHKINSIPYYLIKQIIYENLERAIRKNNNDEYDRWAEYEWMLYDSYTMNQGALESVAMEYRNNYALNKLIAVNVDRYDSSYSRSILEYALSYGNSNVRENALDNLDIDASDAYGYTLIEEYAKDDNLTLVRLLIEYGANTTITDRNGNNLLHIAAQNNANSVLEFLIGTRGMDLDARNENSQTLLEYYVINNDTYLVKRLVKNGADTSIKSSTGMGLLQLAVTNNADNMVDYLIGMDGMDLDEPGENGRTLLHDAALENNLDLIEQLLSNGAHKNALDNNKNTVLHIAAKHGSEQMVSYLIKQGVKTHTKNKYKLLPEKVAKKAKRKKIAKMLKKARKRS